MKEIESFYRNLYTSHDEDNKEAFNDFVRDLQTDNLTDEERENLEGYITIEECSKVLKTFPACKSPYLEMMVSRRNSIIASLIWWAVT